MNSRTFRAEHLAIPDEWEVAPIGACLREETRPISMDNSELYHLVSVRRNYGGLFYRTPLLGRQILTKALRNVVPGSFIIARRQIVHGACAFVEPEFEGSVVSNSYSSFNGTSKCDPKYFSWLAQHPLLRAYFLSSSHGIVIEKMNFDQGHWLTLSIPLPPIREQKKIAEILDTVDESIRSTERLITKLGAIRNGILMSLISAVEERFVLSLNHCIYRIEAGKSPDVPDRPASTDEWGVLKVSAVRPWGLDDTENKVITRPAVINPRHEVQAGDLLITRANTPQLVGLTCYVQSTRPRLLLSDKTLRLVAKKDATSPQYLNYALSSQDARRQIETSGTGSSGSMKNISQREIRSIRIPLPHIAEQERIVEIVESAERTITRESETLAKLRKVKQGLMEDLHTGRVRVKVD